MSGLSTNTNLLTFSSNSNFTGESTNNIGMQSNVNSETSYLASLMDLYNTPLDFKNISVALIEKLTAQYKDASRDTFDFIANTTTLNFSTVMQPLINLEIATQRASLLISFPKQIHTDEVVREASSIAVKDVANFDITQEMRDDVYKVFKAYYDNIYPSERANLTNEEKRYVEDTFRDYHRRGMTLESIADRIKVKEIKQRLEGLNTDFNHNINEDTTTFEFSRAELFGLPDDWFNAERLVRDDVYKVTLKYPDYIPIMDYCHNRAVREKMFLAFNSRCREENTKIATETLQLRQELSVLLGYATSADFSTELKMTKNAANLAKFLDEMNERFRPIQESTLTAMRDFARKELNDPTFELQHHDIRYITKMREKALCQIDHKIIQDYFPREKVVTSTMQMYQEILGLSFHEINTTNKWHEDTQCYEVYDVASTEILGSFVLDLSPREGKYSHAAVFNLINGSEISKFTGIANKRQIHFCVMLCNFPKDQNMSFEDVTTFFHEFGHLMHHICSKTQLASYVGLNVELDFVEAPSQMLENWCYNQNVLARLSAHKDTGEPIPVAMVTKLLDAERLHIGVHNKRQLSFATFDYLVHSLSAQDLVAFDINAFWSQVNQKITLLPDAGDSLPSTFGHLFGNEYYAGYYGYMYSEVVALCMFEEMFKADPLNKEAGARYRKCILEPGATKDARELVFDFLGHEPTIDAFLRHCGLQEALHQVNAPRITG